MLSVYNHTHFLQVAGVGWGSGGCSYRNSVKFNCGSILSCSACIYIGGTVPHWNSCIYTCTCTCGMVHVHISQQLHVCVRVGVHMHVCRCVYVCVYICK